MGQSTGPRKSRRWDLTLRMRSWRFLYSTVHYCNIASFCAPRHASPTHISIDTRGIIVLRFLLYLGKSFFSHPRLNMKAVSGDNQRSRWWKKIIFPCLCPPHQPTHRLTLAGIGILGRGAMNSHTNDCVGLIRLNNKVSH